MHLPILKKISPVINWIKKHKILTAIIFLVLAGVIFFLWPKPPTPLETYKVKEGNIQQILSASGKVESDQTVTLNFLSAGKLVYVGAQKGDEVKKGQVIAQLDQRSVQKNIASQLKELSIQRNSFESTREANKDKPLTDDIRRILDTNQNNLDKALISAELQQLTREQSVLVSPIDGVLVESGANIPGVNVSATTNYIIADPYNLLFKIDVDEADIGRVRLDQQIVVVLDAYPERKIRVPVQFIDLTSHKTDTGANAFTVEALLPGNDNFEYRIGMSGDAEIVTSEKRGIIVIPIASVVDEKFVYVKKEKAYEKRPVRLGLQSDTEIEIQDGLKIGEDIAIQPEEAAKLVKK